jgi:hypothetical protein
MRDDSLQVCRRLSRRSHKFAKPRIRRTHEAPNDARNNDRQRSVTKSYVENVVTFAGDPGSDDTGDQ